MDLLDQRGADELRKLDLNSLGFLFFSIASTANTTIDYIFPVTLPFFPPCKWTVTYGAHLAR